MKIDNNALNMISGWSGAGDLIMMEQMPILGGYAGGVEETAICDVAATLASFVMFNCDIHLDGPIHVRWGTTSTPETLMVAAHAGCALDRNTDFLLGNQYYTAAGPGTIMCFLEAAAQAITDTASGRELISGVAAAKGVTMDTVTGLEARMIGKVAEAAAGEDADTINKILIEVLSRYAGEYTSIPTPKRFQDCYDAKSCTPKDEYLRVYEKAERTLRVCGLNI